MTDYQNKGIQELRKIVAKLEKAAGRHTAEIQQRWKKQRCLDYLAQLSASVQEPAKC